MLYPLLAVERRDAKLIRDLTGRLLDIEGLSVNQSIPTRPTVLTANVQYQMETIRERWYGAGTVAVASEKGVDWRVAVQ